MAASTRLPPPRPPRAQRNTAALADLNLGDLTEPRHNTVTVRRILAMYLTKTLALFRSIPLSVVEASNRALYQETVDLLAAAHAADQQVGPQIFRLPTVNAFVHCIAGQLHPAGDRVAINAWLRELCGQVALELAIVGRLARPVHIGSGTDGRLPLLCSPTANVAITVRGLQPRVRFSNGLVQIEAGGERAVVDLRDPQPMDSQAVKVWRPYARVVAGLWVTDCDNNPLAMSEAHPDKHGNRPDLGGHSVQQWATLLAEAIALIDQHLPLLGEELRLLARVFVAVGYDAERHLSASYQEVIGTIYLTLHPQLMTMAEAVVHEFQHNKINAMFHFDPLLHNAWTPLYSSPVRPDPRPLHGVVLAVHAFQPVARLYEQMSLQGHALATQTAWNERFARIITLDRAGAATALDHALPTALGSAFFAQMRQLDEHLGELAAQRWPNAAPTQANLDEVAGHD
ncbi:MAG: hypothetical protein EXR77_17260 [Myxococcales bacterium]|nr:hypothetical protein [Myxococcales bacterium]